LLIGIWLLAAAGGVIRSEEDSLGPQKIENFSLRDFRGKPLELTELDEHQIVVVAFIGIECPSASLYADRLRQLADRYRSRGVAFVLIDSNSQDSVTEIAHWAKKHLLELPVLKDVGNHVADQFAAERTPEVYVLDRQRVVRYRGRIDDQFSSMYRRPEPDETYLIDAIEAILENRAVKIPFTESEGCRIGRIRSPDAASDVTYSREISRILQDRCVVCHREGEIAPFALTQYDAVAGWAEMIDEVVQEGRMPPWHATEGAGPFSNDARLSAEEKQTIHRWVRAGAPEGDRRDLPEPRSFTTGWQIPEPDLVLAVQKQPHQLPASGAVAYQYFVVDPGFQEDKWVRAAQCRPGNRAVVHHMIAFIQPPDTDLPRTPKDRSALGSLWLASAAPGTPPMNLPQGYAKRVPAGSQLIFQVHYTTNGTPQQDQSHLGLVFAKPDTVKKEVGTWRAANTEFTIPPGAADYEVKATYKFRDDVFMLTAFPHMHLRGKSFRFEAEYPDGRHELLLDVPRYDFNWQNSYEFSSPRRIPAGTRLNCTAKFDNSANNPNNPNPSATVRWGDQNWDEMMAGHFEVVLADPPSSNTYNSKRRTDSFLASQRASMSKEPDDLLANVNAALGLDAAAEPLRQFAIALQDEVPQVDRVDVMQVRDDGLEVLLDTHPTDNVAHLAGKGLKVPAGNLAIVNHARGEVPVAHDALSQESAGDLQYMAREFESSLHIPVRINGQPASVNFWSQEPSAFPPETFHLLRRVAERLSRQL
jgi:peroxiredoxin